MSWKTPQVSDLVGCKRKIKKLVADLEKVNRPDRVVAIMYKIRYEASMYNHCYYELVKNGMTPEEYHKNVGRL